MSASGEQLQIAASQGAQKTSEDAQTASNEVIEEQLIRDLMNEHLVLLRCTLGHKDGKPQTSQCFLFSDRHLKDEILLEMT